MMAKILTKNVRFCMDQHSVFTEEEFDKDKIKSTYCKLGLQANPGNLKDMGFLFHNVTPIKTMSILEKVSGISAESKPTPQRVISV